MDHQLTVRNAGILAGILALTLSLGLQAQDEANYVDIADDLGQGKDLKDVADRAHGNAERYWETAHGHEERPEGSPESDSRDGPDEDLSAGEAVTAIYTHANAISGADPLALDIVNVAAAVIDSWPDCQDTFDAVRAAVELEPGRADEIVAGVAFKRNCNCHNGGLWLDKRVDERIRVEMRHNILDVPFQCSCSQVAMYAGIAGLPENRAWDDNLPEDEKQALIARMTERVQVITDRTASMQSRNDWECGCTDINIAAAMQGIPHDDLRGGTYDRLAEKYAREAADKGLVVDSFGVVGTYPQNHWGAAPTVSRSNVLQRKGEIFRGDNLILDPFDPAYEFIAQGDRNFSHLGRHAHSSGNIPSDLFISEYVEGWNEEALDQPAGERDPEHRNRVVELYNGGDEVIDLGNDQYFLEIYAPGDETRTVVTPPLLVKKTISLESDVTFEFDRAEVRAEAGEDLQKVVEVLNEADIFSEILIQGYSCDLGPEDYNLALSERRAGSVRDFLQKSGLKDVPIRTAGLGEANPRLPNVSEANRARNRRVDITFVTREGEEVETSVAESDAGGPKKMEYTFLVPLPPAVHEVESEPASSMAEGEYSDGDMSPRQVIGLNGAIEPGETWIIAFARSDDSIKDLAQEVTAQLDFKPYETLVLRRLGGEMALNCRAQSYEYVINFPALPYIRYPEPGTQPRSRPPEIEVASPN